MTTIPRYPDSHDVSHISNHLTSTDTQAQQHQRYKENKQIQLQIAQQHWKRLLHYQDNTTNQEKETFVIEQNFKQNFTWDNLLLQKPANTIQIYVQNINGVNVKDIEGNYNTLAQHMHEAQADIMCFQEHNLATEKHEIRNKIKTLTKQHWPCLKLLITQSPISYTSVKK